MDIDAKQNASIIIPTQQSIHPRGDHPVAQNVKTVQENFMLSDLLLKSENKVKEMVGHEGSFVLDDRPNEVVGCRPDLAPIMFPHLYLLEQVIDLILSLP
jgi:hypothetical protein